MTTPDRDLEEFLRRGLHAAAESIEPGPDGLEHIRRRVASRRPQRHFRLLLTDCADLVRLLVLRLEPAMSWLARSARRGTAALHREGPGHREAPGHRLRRSGGFRPASEWLRPAMVVATAVVIVVAGVFGLTKLRQQPVTNLGNLASQGSSSSSSSSHPARGSVTGTGSSAPSRSTSNPGVVPAPSSSPSPSKSASATTKPTCTSGSPSAQPSSTATPSPTPTLSSSPSATPTGTAADSATPAGTGSATGQSGGSAGGSSGSASPSSAPCGSS